MPADLIQQGDFNYTEIGSGAVTYDGLNMGFLKDVTFISNLDLEKLYTGNPLQLRGQKGKQYVCQLQAEMFEVSDMDKVSLLLGGGLVPQAVGGSPTTKTEQTKTFAAPIGRSLEQISFDMPTVSSGGSAPVILLAALTTATNSPGAGSDVVIDVPSTANLVNGGYAYVKDGNHAEKVQITAVVADTSITVAALANAYVTPEVHAAFAEGTDYLVDYNARPYAIAYRHPSGNIPAGAQVKTTYTGTPPTGHKLLLGSSFQVARKQLVFEHYNNDTGKIWKSTFWIASPDGKANFKWTDGTYAMSTITFDSIPDDVGHPESPYGEVYVGDPA
jgi:hypothetical protein